MTLVTLSNGRTFAADSHVSILDSALGHGIVLEYSCRSGRCGVCKASVIRGDTIVLREEESLTETERQQGRVLTCCRAAAGEVELDVADLSRLAGITIKTVPCRIAELRHLGPDILGVTLRLPPGSPLGFLPGQYVDVISNEARRSYSIANAPRSDNRVELHVRNYPGGVMSRFWFEKAKLGDLLRFQAPLGTFFFRNVVQGPILFLATGTGIAPVKAILEEMAAAPALAAGRAIHIYWGNRTRKDQYWSPAPAPGLDIRFIPIYSREGGDGRPAYVQDAAVADFARFEDAEVYACGSQDMINSARTALLARGLHPQRFFSDAFVISH